MCRCIRDRVCWRCASIVVVTSFLVEGSASPPAGGSLCLGYARFMCTPHHGLVRTHQCQEALRQSAAIVFPFHVVSCRGSPPLAATLVRCTTSDLSVGRDHAAFRRTRAIRSHRAAMPSASPATFRSTRIVS